LIELFLGISFQTEKLNHGIVPQMPGKFAGVVFRFAIKGQATINSPVDDQTE